MLSISSDSRIWQTSSICEEIILYYLRHKPHLSYHLTALVYFWYLYEISWIDNLDTGKKSKGKDTCLRQNDKTGTRTPAPQCTVLMTPPFNSVIILPIIYTISDSRILAENMSSFRKKKNFAFSLTYLISDLRCLSSIFSQIQH